MAAISGQRGAATRALITQRRGAVFVVAVQPAHHGLRVTPGAHGHRGGACAVTDRMPGQEALAGASVASIQSQVTQISQCLAPMLMVNA